jgi:hypothetical protein
MPIFKTRLFSNTSFILAIYIAAAAIACIVKIRIDLRPHDATNYISKINNFIIFRSSFFHLIQHLSLYGAHVSEQYDLYKYSPTFALLFAPFAILPVYPGAVLWAVFNSVLLFTAVYKLPIPDHRKTFIWWFMLLELITSIQNSQVNPIIAALFLFTFIAFEKRQVMLAALLIVLSAYIKVYGILGASLFLLYPDKLKFVLYSLLWFVLFFAAPLLIISIDELFNQYAGWKDTITNDHQSRAVDVSIMRFIMSIGHIPFNDKLRLCIQIGGITIFCIKYIRVQLYKIFHFRFLFLASIMIWSIVFNHLAESATYIIAIAGAALWYTTEHKSRLASILIIAVFVLSILSPTDIFPRGIRELYIVPYAIKALPCFLVWLFIEYKLLSGRVETINLP